MWKCKESRKTEKIFRNNKIGRPTLPNFETYDKALVAKKIWYQCKNRPVNQWNRIKSPEMDPCIYGQLIFRKGIKVVQWGKE